MPLAWMLLGAVCPFEWVPSPGNATLWPVKSAHAGTKSRRKLAVMDASRARSLYLPTGRAPCPRTGPATGADGRFATVPGAAPTLRLKFLQQAPITPTDGGPVISAPAATGRPKSVGNLAGTIA